MKTKRFHPVVLATIGAAVFGVQSGVAAPLQASVVRQGSTVAQTVYVVEAKESGLVLSASPNGSNGRLTAFDKIASVTLSEPEGWGQALGAYRKGDYKRAITLFGKLADEYETIASYEDSPGARARFYEIDSLRREGQYDTLAKKVTRLGIKPIKLGESYADQLSLFSAWAQAGSKDWRALERTLGGYEAGEGAGGGQNKIKPLGSAQLIQVAYLRGMLAENAGRPGDALNDYARAYSFAPRSESGVAKQAVLAALNLLKANESIATDENLRKEAHSLVTLLTKKFGSLTVPAEFQEFEKLPE